MLGVGFGGDFREKNAANEGLPAMTRLENDARVEKKLSPGIHISPIFQPRVHSSRKRASKANVLQSLGSSTLFFFLIEGRFPSSQRRLVRRGILRKVVCSKIREE